MWPFRQKYAYVKCWWYVCHIDHDQKYIKQKYSVSMVTVTAWQHVLSGICTVRQAASSGWLCVDTGPRVLQSLGYTGPRVLRNLSSGIFVSAWTPSFLHGRFLPEDGRLAGWLTGAEGKVCWVLSAASHPPQPLSTFTAIADQAACLLVMWRLLGSDVLCSKCRKKGDISEESKYWCCAMYDMF